MPDKKTVIVKRKKITFEVPLVILRIKRDKMRTISVTTEHISNVIIRGIKCTPKKNSIPAK